MKLIAAIFFIACSAAHAERPIRIQIGTDPASLDPNHIASLLGTSIAYNLYRTLVTLDENGKIVPDLAEKYEISKDGRTYKFKMRSGAKWSDGKAVTVEDCVFGMLDPLDPKTANEDADMLFPIKGAQEFYQGKGKREAVAVKRAGDWCQIELAKPNSAFLGTLTLAMTSPKRADQKGHFPGPTTGHYVIQSQSPSEIKLAPNPMYHEDGQLPIEIKVINEEAAALNLFETGKLDLLTAITPTEIPRLQKMDVVVQRPMSATNFIGFNTKKAPFDQLDWRKAVAAAIDRDGLGKVLGVIGTPTTCFLPSDTIGFAKTDAPKFNEAVERIRKLENKSVIHIGYAPSGMAELVLEKIQHDLHTKLGADVRLEPTEQKVYFKSLNTHAAPPIYFLGNASLGGTPDLHLRHFIDDVAEGGNASEYHSDKYESLFKKIQAEMNEAKRAKLIHEALHVLQEEDVVMVPLFERNQIYAMSPRLSGFHAIPSSEIQLYRLRLTEGR